MEICSLVSVPAHIINGDQWITARLAYLRELLTGDLTDEQRKTVEHEIAVLSKESGIGFRGRRYVRLLRRWRKR